MVSIN
jgi:superfamily II DNA helicase RecQ